MTNLPPPPFFVLHGHEGNITALHFSNDSNEIIKQPSLLSGSDIGEIFIWDLQNFRTYFKLLDPQKNTVLSLKYHKSKLLSLSRDGRINIWIYKEENWKIIRNFTSDSAGFCQLAFWITDLGTYFASINQEKYMLTVFDFDSETQVKELNLESKLGLCMSLKVVHIRTKWYLLMCYESGDIILWDYSKDCRIHSQKLHKEVITCMDFDDQHKMRGVSGSTDEFLLVWKITDDLQLEKIHELKLTSSGVSDVKIRQDGKIIIVASWDFNIRIFSWKTLKQLAVLCFHEQSILCLEISLGAVDKKASVFASGSKDKNIALWSIY